MRPVCDNRPSLCRFHDVNNVAADIAASKNIYPISLSDKSVSRHPRTGFEIAILILIPFELELIEIGPNKGWHLNIAHANGVVFGVETPEDVPDFLPAIIFSCTPDAGNEFLVVPIVNWM